MSVIIPLCLAVLLACGWRREIAGTCPLPAVLAVLAAPLFAAGIPLDLGDGLVAGADQAVYAAASLLAFAGGKDGSKKMVAVTVALTVAIICHLPYTLQRLAGEWPHLPGGFPALWAGVVAAWLSDRPQLQFAALWFGFSAAALWAQSLAEAVRIVFGGRELSDGIWLSFVCARLVSLAIQWARLGANRLLSRHK